MLRYQVLASGSNGNSAILQLNDTLVLIDAGISLRRTSQRLKALNFELADITHILITHAHTDHITGLLKISEKTRADIIMTPGTLDDLILHFSSPRSSSSSSSPKVSHGQLVKLLEKITPISLGSTLKLENLSITSLPTYHDATESTGYYIQDTEQNVALTTVTDTGKFSPEILKAAFNSHVLLVESNYNRDLLYQSARPWILKRRIEQYHLSNAQTIKALLQLQQSPRLQFIFLGHLSGDCNSIEQVQTELSLAPLDFGKHPAKHWIICPRHEPSSLLTIENSKWKLKGGISSAFHPLLHSPP